MLGWVDSAVLRIDPFVLQDKVYLLLISSRAEDCPAPRKCLSRRTAAQGRRARPSFFRPWRMGSFAMPAAKKAGPRLRDSGAAVPQGETGAGPEGDGFGVGYYSKLFTSFGVDADGRIAAAELA